MPRPTIIPHLAELLRLHLDLLQANFTAKPEEKRTPTLPCLPDGQVNAEAIILAAGWTKNQRQMLYKAPELADIINAVAIAQGLKPVGSRSPDILPDPEIKKRLDKLATEISELRSLLAEREATILSLRRQLAAERGQFTLLTETGMALRTSSIAVEEAPQCA